MVKNILTVLLSFITINMFTQNLVKDPSFENFTRCPRNFTQNANSFLLKEWWLPTKGTPDYMNSCANESTGYSIPKNKNGYQNARTGLGYLYSVNTKNKSLIEFVQSELEIALQKNEEYYVEFWVSLAENSIYSSNKLGVYFGNKKYYAKVNEMPNDIIPQIKSEKFISDVDNWVKISGIYKAKGGEKFIVLGCFVIDDSDFNKVAKNPKSKLKGACYYIDDVLVERVKKDTISTKQFVSELNKPIILENITFEFSKSELKESSFAELNELAATLKENPTYQITLSGHTDNVGQEEDNLKLSQARAKAVAEYLTSKGIAPTRISYKGYGSKNPITTNETEQGREQNRRVEFILTQDEK